MDHTQTNSNLVWNLDKISNRLRATNFVMQFKRTLSVYSGPVQQLYTNYDIVLPQGEDDKLIILPNPLAHHDTFNYIPEDAVRPTGISIIPGEMVGKKGLYLSIPIKTQPGESRLLPMKSGLHAIMSRYPKTAPFVPVLTKGDLREFQADVPCVHLHRILIEKLPHLSAMEIQDMIRVTLKKLAVYMNPPAAPATPQPRPANPTPAARPAAPAARPATPTATSPRPAGLAPAKSTSPGATTPARTTAPTGTSPTRPSPVAPAVPPKPRS